MKQLSTSEILPASDIRGESNDLMDHWRSLVRRKWSILALATVIALLAALVVSTIRPVYRASSTVLMETSKNKVVSVEELYTGSSANREFFQTQLEIVRSREIAQRVVSKLKLSQNAEFDPRQRAPTALEQISQSIGMASIGAPSRDQDVEASVTRQIQGQVTVEIVRSSQLMRINFEAHDPELAAQVANTFADAFIESDLESRFTLTQKAADWLNSRISGLRQKLADSEKALQDFRDREKIVDAKGLAMSGASTQLADMTKALNEARQRRTEIENAVNQIRALKNNGSNSYESIPAVMKSPLFIDGKKSESEAEKKVAELSQRYGREHPRLVQAEAELKAAKENTKRQIDTVIAGLIKEFENLKANETNVDRNLVEARETIQTLNRKEYQLGLLEREVATNRQLYDLFIGRSKEASATNDLQSPVGRVVERAAPPNTPIRPVKTQIVGSAFAVGLLIATIVALLLERLDNTIKSSEEVESKLGIPVLSTVPLIAGKKEAAKLSYLVDPKSVFSESIRTARTGVLLSGIDSEHKILVITSSVPDEGKTTFAMNLAFAHAQTKRVLLIDSDMRRPSIAKTLGVEANAFGLSDFISGNATVSQVIHSIEGTTAKILPAGNTPPNPLELLLSPKFALALLKLKELFDVIILDTPPVQLVSDAAIVARQATGVIYVVKADATPIPLARIGLKKLRPTGIPIIGIILNQLDLKRADRYYGEYSGYGAYGYKQYYGAGHR